MINVRNFETIGTIPTSTIKKICVEEGLIKILTNDDEFLLYNQLEYGLLEGKFAFVESTSEI